MSWLRGVVAMGAVAVLAGCPSTGVVCRAGTTPCGLGCVDTANDVRNCGACGRACGSSEECVAGACACTPGTARCGATCVVLDFDARHCGACGNACAADQVCNEGACACPTGATTCGAACVITSTDAKNCGACGNACAADEVCEAGACKGSCSAGLLRCGSSCVDGMTSAQHCGTCGNACATGQVCTAGACGCPASASLRCGDACVDPMTSAQHCGACGNACAQGQTCRAGACGFEAVAACYWSGQVVGFSASTGSRGPLSDLGTNPGALASYQGTLLAADGMDNRLYQAVPGAAGAFNQTSRASTTGAVPNQVLVDAPYVYIANASSGTLQVLKVGADGGTLSLGAGVDGGLLLGTVAELPLGANSYPQGVAKLGDSLWVPLYGGFGASAAQAGQQVVRISVANPEAPAELGRVGLQGLDLKPFDGGAPVARPWAITARGGALYVALNNLNPDTYAPEGPGLVARINPADGGVSVIDLGGQDCLNPQWLAPVGDGLAVSCGGQVTYSPTYAVDAVSQAGLVLLDGQDRKAAAWSSACPADAGVLADGGAACPPMMPGRLSVVGRRILLGDQNAGRVVFLDATDAGLVEVKGVTSALTLCPISPLTGAGNVSDVLGSP